MTRTYCLRDLTTVAVASRLKAVGLSELAVAAKTELFARAAGALQQAGLDAQAKARAFFVPGRIEILGKHTDYAGGRSLLSAVEQGFAVVVVPRKDATVRLINVAADETRTFEMSPDITPPAGHWTNYPMTVARRLARNFPGKLRGADVAFVSDLPPASGMSSSSAMVVATFLVLDAVNDFRDRDEYTANIKSPEDLAEYLGTCENGQSFRGLAGDKGVGTFGGSEDHTAILCCRAGRFSQYCFCPVVFERDIPLPKEWIIVVASSGVIAEKTGAAMEQYNRASLRARAAADVWQQETSQDQKTLADIVASDPNADERLREILSRVGTDEFKPADLLTRFEQFYAESEQIIPAAGDALVAGNMEEFGKQVDRSQKLAQTKLNNQVPETIHLAAAARQIGAVAASAFGAGFGGSVWAMVATETADAFVKKWADDYRKTFPQPAARSSFFTTHPAPAAFEL